MNARLKRFLEKSLEGIDSAHGMKHTKVTAVFAKIIAEREEGAPVKLCVLAALLHDISRPKHGKWRKETRKSNHGIRGALKARPFLICLGLPECEVELICQAISQHCFAGIQTNLVSRVLWDADKLGMFSREMLPEYVKFWKNQGWSEERTARQIRKERIFYLKSFHTKTAKKLAKQFLAEAV